MKGRTAFGSGQNRLKGVGLLLLAYYKVARTEYLANLVYNLYGLKIDSNNETNHLVPIILFKV